MTTQATYNQTLLDICLQVTGSLDNLVAIAQANDLGVNATLAAGQSCQYSGPAAVPAVAKYFDLNDVVVVTGGGDVAPLVTVVGETSNGRAIPFPVKQPLGNQYQPVYGQSLLDTCLQLNGSLDTLVAMALANDTLVTEVPTLNRYLVFDTQAQGLSAVADAFRLNETYVATLDNDLGLNIIQTEFENSEYEGEEYA